MHRFVMPVILILYGIAGKASASYTLNFEGGNITNNTSQSGADYQVTVYGQADGQTFRDSNANLFTLGAHEVVFMFSVKTGGLGEISEMYFQDGTLLRLAAVNISNVSLNGIKFVADAQNPTNPANLPGGAGLSPIPFYSHDTFSADTVGSNNNTIMAGEQSGILFTLQGGYTYQDTVNALIQGASLATLNSDGTVDMHGGLRIGIHVHDATGQNSNSDSFVNTSSGGRGTPVPEPSTMALALTGIAGLGLAGRRPGRLAPATAQSNPTARAPDRAR